MSSIFLHFKKNFIYTFILMHKIRLLHDSSKINAIYVSLSHLSKKVFDMHYSYDIVYILFIYRNSRITFLNDFIYDITDIILNIYCKH
ncbi:hypothetical protein SDC9_204128 [bioreactor metagenome]|uniref:Uncharacterized protein n=1 Tax=bioreactor metagenome TaxID=1076179 RepID=A0A645J153_9ZZZZ